VGECGGEKKREGERRGKGEEASGERREGGMERRGLVMHKK
jgi:hypothetical protein